MTDQGDIDLSNCRHWRPSTPFGAAHVGIIPAWNAVALLNPAAAAIWNLLIETRDAHETIAAYAGRCPERAQEAESDVLACLKVWQAQGFFRPPAPSQEAVHLQTLEGRARRPHPAAYQRTVLVAGVSTTLAIEDPDLGLVVADLLADFAETDTAPRRALRSCRPPEGWVLEIDGRPARVASSLPLARGHIVAELVRVAGGDIGWRATVHGATLTGPLGAVMLVGESGAGKSTLAAGLVARGWQILSEDLAAFRAGWTVCPLPFALSIKDGAVDTLAPAFPDLARATVHQLGPRRVRYQRVPEHARARRPERPKLFFDVRYTAELGDGPAELDRLTEAEALGLFMNEESYVGFERNDTGDFLDFIAQTPAYRIRYGTIAAADSAIRARLAHHRADDPR